MSIFSDIINKIFPKKPIFASSEIPEYVRAPQQAAPAAPETLQAVDVEALLNQMSHDRAEKLNWRSSIVDLLKLLDLDSSLASRKKLASELQYEGSTEDSAAMNIWLQKQVMKKLAENGGKIPDELLH